jgi:hypothetical protein
MTNCLYDGALLNFRGAHADLFLGTWLGVANRTNKTSDVNGARFSLTLLSRQWH